MSERRSPARASESRWRGWHPGSLILGAVITVAVGMTAAGLVLWTGVYDVAATEQHLRPTYAMLDIGLRRSVVFHARRIEAPRLDDAELIGRGEICFKEHCEQCHGGPGVARAPFALGLTPVPSSLSQASSDWTPAQLYWITRKGIKMTAMPAWEYRLDDGALWSVVAYLLVLPQTDVERYRMQKASGGGTCTGVDRQAAAAAAGDPGRGRIAVQQYACIACHVIPGIVGPESHTGPPLHAMGRRQTIGGVVSNTPDNMRRWLLAPHAISARTAMPELGVKPAHAADIAAFLGSLD